MSLRQTVRAFGLSLAVLLLLTPTLRAQVHDFADFQTARYTQTGPTALSLPTWDFDSRLFETTPGDATDATLTYPGPNSPVTFTANSQTDGTEVLEYNSGSLPDQATLDADYPQGDYTADFTNRDTSAGTVTLSYTQDAFSTSTPTFTAGTFTGAHGVNAAQNFTFFWNNFAGKVGDPGSAATESLIFFSVTDQTTGAVVVNDAFQSATITSATVTAGTLQAGEAYLANLDFSNRIVDASSAIRIDQGFDRVTSFAFQAAPEPSSLFVLGLGTLGTLLLAVRKRFSPVLHGFADRRQRS